MPPSNASSLHGEQRKRKTHAKSRMGCDQCKRRHHKCDEVHPRCGNCSKRDTECSLAAPSPGGEAPTTEQTLAIEDLRLLYHWLQGDNKEDFQPFEDHQQLDKKAENDNMMELAFSHPFLLHTILALSALHLLHRDPSDLGRYTQASAHYSAALRRARPQVDGFKAEHSPAVFSFAALASLYALAEPPLRPPAPNFDGVDALLDSMIMSRGVRAVMEPFTSTLQQSGVLDPTRWSNNEDEVAATLESDYPQVLALQQLVEAHYEEPLRGQWVDAVRRMFTFVGVLATNSKSHSSTRVIMTWVMHIDVACADGMRAKEPVAMVVLAYYAAMINMRTNYWFFRRWPMLLLSSIEKMLGREWDEHLRWPREVVYHNLQPGPMRNL